MKKFRISLFIAIIIALCTSMAYYFDDVKNGINLGLDLQGGFEIVYEVSPLEDGGTIPEMSAIAKSIRKRIDVLGVNEPEIIIEGDNRIRVQLAGIKDQEKAREILTAQAVLSFRDTNDKLLMDSKVLQEGGASLAFQDGMPIVSLKVQDKDKFYEVTKRLAGLSGDKNLIVTWLDFEEGVDSYKEEVKKEDPKYISVAGVNSGINGDAVIQGNFTQEEARELADLINSGSLPVKLTEIYSDVVSAELGVDAYEKTVFAGSIGVLLIMAFMIYKYGIQGILSSLMLLVYTFFTFIIYNTMGGVLTLPGIAAVVLNIGMTVDANVIVFERVKEELYKGRSVRQAFKEGNSLAFSTIFDGQITTLISGIILFFFGTGSIKGFATMLIVGVVGTFLINVYLLRKVSELLVNSGILDNKKKLFNVKEEYIPDLSKGESQRYFGRFTKIDFVGISKYFICGSVIVLLLGFGASAFNMFSNNKAFNLGVDFASGTKITILADEELTVQSVEDKFAELGYEASGVQISGSKNQYANVIIKEAISTKELTELKAQLASYYNHEVNDNVVSPIIGKELVADALYSSLIAWLFIMVYVSLRFKWDFAVGGIVSLIHDALMILAVFAFMRFEVNSELIAVILAIIGYSINDTIVIFDRIRELINDHVGELHVDGYKNLVNKALQQMFERSIYNTLTTLFPMVALLIFGSSAIFEFNVAMFIGLVAGAYSSIFIAAQLWLYLRVKFGGKKKAHKKKKIVVNNEPTEITIFGIND